MLTLVSDGARITELRFGADVCAQDSHEVLLQAEAELNEYFAGRRMRFSVPLFISGTEFQKKVWQALTGIPYGETRSYGEIAAAIGKPKACRAVGMANHVNPLPIFVPCHRVIGAGGSLTGYGGGLPTKVFLLELERNVCQNSKER